LGKFVRCFIERGEEDKKSALKAIKVKNIPLYSKDKL